MIFLILTLSLILPGSSFAFATAQMLIVCMISVASNKRIRTQEFSIFLIIFVLFTLLSFLHFSWTGSANELVDVVRFMPLFSFILLKPKLEESTFTKVFFFVNLINIVAVYLIDKNLLSNVFEHLHARDLEKSWGRHSGIFTNVSNLGFYSLLGVLFAIKKLEKKTDIVNSIILFTSGYLLLLSGSKTGLIIAAGYLTFVGFRLLLFMQINIISIGIILGISGMIYYWEKVIKSFYVIYKILTILTGGLSAASSVQGRFDIWLGYIMLMNDRFTYFMFGLPVSVAELFSTTFDNDGIWLTVRFGLPGLCLFLYFWIKHLKFSRNTLISSAILLSSSFVGVLVSFQLCLFTLCFLYYLEERSSVDQQKVGTN